MHFHCNSTAHICSAFMKEGAKRGLKSAPFYMVREALFLLDPIEIGFEKA